MNFQSINPHKIQRSKMIHSRRRQTKFFFSKVDTLADKNLCCQRIRPSNSQNLIVDDVETGFFLLDLAEQLRRKNADFADTYFTLLNAAGITDSDSKSECQS